MALLGIKTLQNLQKVLKFSSAVTIENVEMFCENNVANMQSKQNIPFKLNGNLKSIENSKSNGNAKSNENSNEKSFKAKGGLKNRPRKALGDISNVDKVSSKVKNWNDEVNG